MEHGSHFLRSIGPGGGDIIPLARLSRRGESRSRNRPAAPSFLAGAERGRAMPFSQSDDQCSVQISDCVDWLNVSVSDKRKRDEVSQEVERIISLYAEERRATFPRQRDDTKSLSRIGDAARKLDRALAGIEGGAFIDLFGRACDDDDEFGYDDAPLSTQDYDSIRDYLSRLLSGLSTLPKKPDKGGRSKEYARHWLVIRCLDIFDRCRSGEASATDGGSFQIFVSLVHEIVTGESESDFGRQIRTVLKLSRSDDSEF